MEDLWKLREMRFRLNDLADRAEYNRLVKRFHEEEEASNLKNLLYNQASTSKNAEEEEKS